MNLYKLDELFNGILLLLNLTTTMKLFSHKALSLRESFQDRHAICRPRRDSELERIRSPAENVSACQIDNSTRKLTRVRLVKNQFLYRHRYE